MKRYFFTVLIVALSGTFCKAQDTLKVMVYNVLHYGDGCQGSNAYLHSQLKNIIKYTNPDIFGMVKMQAIRLNSSDFNGISPVGFADSIINNALDPATAVGKYAYCTLTDVSRDANGDMDVLFYNQSKLGFVSVTNLCAIEEDFNVYKLYYKDTNLAKTHDSTFIYVVLNHTDSNVLTARDEQDSLVIAGLKNIFYHLPNLISMGDFNVATSTEPGYEMYTLTTDTSFLFYDGPFQPDGKFKYPLDWDKNNSCAAYLNTTTRLSSSPNSCGASGGAKDWIEHILMSGWLVDSIDYVSYIRNSYTTVGNDGKHFEISINDSVNGPKNISAPNWVINSLFNLSDKYPISVKLKVNSNINGTGPVNPVNGLQSFINPDFNIYAENPFSNKIVLHFPNSLIGKTVLIKLYDIQGRLILTADRLVETKEELTVPDQLTNGVYIASMQIGQYTKTIKLVK